MASRFTCAHALAVLLQAPSATFGPAPGADDIVGTWAGTVEHDGETAPIALEFERRGDEVRASVVVPAFHGRSGLGPANVVGDRVEIGDLVLTLDRAAQTLSATFPKGLVPRYQPRMELKRVERFSLPSRPEPTAPVRQPRWRVDLGAPLWADVAFRNGRVFVGADDGRVHAVEAGAGKKLWSFQTGGAVRARVAFVGDDVVVPSDEGMLYRLDARTGAERWRVRIGDPIRRVPISDRNGRYQMRAPAVAVAGDRLYVGAGRRLLALGAASGDRVWAFDAGDDMATTPTVANGRVYAGSFDRHVYALSASDGAVMWKYDTGDAATSDVAANGDDVIVGSRSYDLEALDARTGTPRWKKYFWFSWVESSPVVFRGAIYVGSSDAAKVMSVDPGSGRSLWEADAYGSAWGTPAVTETTVYEGVAGVVPYSAPHRGGIVAFDRREGRLVWWYAARAPEPVPTERTAYGFPGSVAIGAGMMFAGGLDGILYAFAE